MRWDRLEIVDVDGDGLTILDAIGDRCRAEGKSAAESVVGFLDGEPCSLSTDPSYAEPLAAFPGEDVDRTGCKTALGEGGEVGVCPFAAFSDQSEVMPSPVFTVSIVVVVTGDSKEAFASALSGITRSTRFGNC